jgi:hypothetical protein
MFLLKSVRVPENSAFDRMPDITIADRGVIGCKIETGQKGAFKDVK